MGQNNETIKYVRSEFVDQLEEMGAIRELDPGTEVRTEAQRSQSKMHFAQLNKEHEIRARGEPFVQFLYNMGESIFDELCAEDVVRLFYVATFVGYDGQLKFVDKSNPKEVPITKRMLKGMLAFNCGEAQFKRFWSNVESAGYLYENEQKTICVNPNVFLKGKMQAVELTNSRIKVYVNFIRNLVDNPSLAKKDLKHAAYILRAIPFLDLKTNIVCYNPDRDWFSDPVQPMVFGDFCDVVGYSRDHAARLLNEMCSVKMPNGADIIRFVGNKWDARSVYIVVNPQMMFGQNMRFQSDVELLWDDKNLFIESGNEDT